MKGAAYGLLVIGIIVGLFAVINKYAHFAFAGQSHMNLYIGIVGAVLAVIGIALVVMGGRSGATN